MSLTKLPQEFTPMSTLSRSAHDVTAIADDEPIIVDGPARATLFRALAEPPPANERLVALAKRHAREVKSRA
ncbi:MAG TPA: hypothetical protein VK669_04360 [Candidatus Limnocylindrales bacterium]|nr:hypothetical protein [Candidatus Limnocylindrales bacterium]